VVRKMIDVVSRLLQPHNERQKLPRSAKVYGNSTIHPIPQRPQVFVIDSQPASTLRSQRVWAGEAINLQFAASPPKLSLVLWAIWKVEMAHRSICLPDFPAV
jgi:hypothetical protein